MKLVFAATAAALILTSAASAMSTAPNIDPIDLARGTLGQMTTGTSIDVAVKDYANDGRSAAQLIGDTLTITRFETSQRPQNSTDLR